VKKFRLVVPFLGLVVAAFAVASMSVSAASTSSSTNLSLNVPSTITMTGIAASYSASIPAGTSFDVVEGPAVIMTNNPTGYSLTVQADGAFTAGSNSISSTIDSVSAGSGAPVGLRAASARQIALTSAPSTDTWTLHNLISVPGTAVPATYTLVETYVATTNP
jgi:hypothetical protein